MFDDMIDIKEVRSRWKFLGYQQIRDAIDSGALKARRPKKGAKWFTRPLWVQEWLASWESNQDDNNNAIAKPRKKKPVISDEKPRNGRKKRTVTIRP